MENDGAFQSGHSPLNPPNSPNPTWQDFQGNNRRTWSPNITGVFNVRNPCAEDSMEKYQAVLSRYVVENGSAASSSLQKNLRNSYQPRQQTFGTDTHAYESDQTALNLRYNQFRFPFPSSYHKMDMARHSTRFGDNHQVSATQMPLFQRPPGSHPAIEQRPQGQNPPMNFLAQHQQPACPNPTTDQWRQGQNPITNVSVHYQQTPASSMGQSPLGQNAMMYHPAYYQPHPTTNLQLLHPNSTSPGPIQHQQPTVEMMRGHQHSQPASSNGQVPQQHSAMLYGAGQLHGPGQAQQLTAQIDQMYQGQTPMIPGTAQYQQLAAQIGRMRQGENSIIAGNGHQQPSAKLGPMPQGQNSMMPGNAQYQQLLVKLGPMPQGQNSMMPGNAQYQQFPAKLGPMPQGENSIVASNAQYQPLSTKLGPMPQWQNSMMPCNTQYQQLPAKLGPVPQGENSMMPGNAQYQQLPAKLGPMPQGGNSITANDAKYEQLSATLDLMLQGRNSMMPGNAQYQQPSPTMDPAGPQWPGMVRTITDNADVMTFTDAELDHVLQTANLRFDSDSNYGLWFPGKPLI